MIKLPRKQIKKEAKKVSKQKNQFANECAMRRVLSKMFTRNDEEEEEQSDSFNFFDLDDPQAGYTMLARMMEENKKMEYFDKLSQEKRNQIRTNPITPEDHELKEQEIRRIRLFKDMTGSKTRTDALKMLHKYLCENSANIPPTVIESQKRKMISVAMERATARVVKEVANGLLVLKQESDKPSTSGETCNASESYKTSGESKQSAPPIQTKQPTQLNQPYQLSYSVHPQFNQPIQLNQKIELNQPNQSATPAQPKQENSYEEQNAKVLSHVRQTIDKAIQLNEQNHWTVSLSPFTPSPTLNSPPKCTNVELSNVVNVAATVESDTKTKRKSRKRRKDRRNKSSLEKANNENTSNLAVGHLGSSADGNSVESSKAIRNRKCNDQSNDHKPNNSIMNSNNQIVDGNSSQMELDSNLQRMKTLTFSDSIEEIFRPKDIDLDDLDEFERELEEFKRFCHNTVVLQVKKKAHFKRNQVIVYRRGPIRLT